jgi:hypothetical protein
MDNSSFYLVGSGGTKDVEVMYLLVDSTNNKIKISKFEILN